MNRIAKKQVVTNYEFKSFDELLIVMLKKVKRIWDYNEKINWGILVNDTDRARLIVEANRSVYYQDLIDGCNQKKTEVRDYYQWKAVRDLVDLLNEEVVLSLPIKVEPICTKSKISR